MGYSGWAFQSNTMTGSQTTLPAACGLLSFLGPSVLDLYGSVCGVQGQELGKDCAVAHISRGTKWHTHQLRTLHV